MENELNQICNQLYSHENNKGNEISLTGNFHGYFNYVY